MKSFEKESMLHVVPCCIYIEYMIIYVYIQRYSLLSLSPHSHGLFGRQLSLLGCFVGHDLGQAAVVEPYFFWFPECIAKNAYVYFNIRLIMFPKHLVQYDLRSWIWMNFGVSHANIHVNFSHCSNYDWSPLGATLDVWIKCFRMSWNWMHPRFKTLLHRMMFFRLKRSPRVGPETVGHSRLLSALAGSLSATQWFWRLGSELAGGTVSCTASSQVSNYAICQIPATLFGYLHSPILHCSLQLLSYGTLKFGWFLHDDTRCAIWVYKMHNNAQL